MTPCPCCGRTAGRRLKRFPSYVRCTCGLVRLGSPPTTSYDDAYFSDDAALGGRDFESQWAEHYDAVRFDEELDRLGAPRRGDALLDYGSATGGFLVRAAGRGWDAAGIEVSAHAREVSASKGARAYESLAALPAGASFDVVTMHHVLEHLDDPVASLTAVRGVLRPGGRLLVEVPNWRSIERLVEGNRWVDLRADQHLWQFSESSLRRVLSRGGFAVEECETLNDPLPSARSVLSSIGVPPSITDRIVRDRRNPASGQPEAEASSSLALDANVDASGETRPTRATRLARIPDAFARAVRLGKRLRVVARPAS